MRKVFLQLSSILILSHVKPVPSFSPKVIKQTLTFPEASTNVAIHIIGTMHYNPHSISKTSSIIRSYGETNHLGSIVVESCRTRWKSKLSSPRSEFRIAAEVGAEFLLMDVVLADENLAENDARVNDAFLSSLKDLCDPLRGWREIWMDFEKGYRESIDPSSVCKGEYLDWGDLFDPGMVFSTPIAIQRYYEAFWRKEPLKGTLLFSWIGFLAVMLSQRGLDGLTLTERGLASMGGFVLSLAVGLPLLGRVFLVALLGERNEILAQNIRKECKRLVETGAGDKVCVVVLGLAHCNGVKRLLCE